MKNQLPILVVLTLSLLPRSESHADCPLQSDDQWLGERIAVQVEAAAGLGSWEAFVWVREDRDSDWGASRLFEGRTSKAAPSGTVSVQFKARYTDDSDPEDPKDYRLHGTCYPSLGVFSVTITSDDAIIEPSDCYGGNPCNVSDDILTDDGPTGVDAPWD